MVVVPRYDCARCPRRGLIADDMALTGRVRVRDGKACGSWCRDCRAAKQAEYDARRDPEATRAAGRRAYEKAKRDPERLRAVWRERKRRQLATPEGRARSAAAARRYRTRNRRRVLEDQRIDLALRRERETGELRPVARERVRLPNREAANRLPQLPAAPLAALVQREVDRAVAEHTDGARATLDAPNLGGYLEGSGPAAAVLERFQIAARTLYRWRTQEGATAQFDVAERVLIELGLNPWDVWDPAECPEVACLVA